MSYICKSITVMLLLSFLVGCGKSYSEEQLIGRFDHQENEYTYIVFYEDGVCEFAFSYLHGVCEANGTYSIQGDHLAIALTDSKPTDSYPGDFLIESHQAGYMDLEYDFTIIDENTIQINKMLYAAREGSQFIRQDINL